MKTDDGDKGFGKTVEYLALSYNTIVLVICVAVFILIGKI